MLATHVYMYRSPRCSVEIEIEIEIEKGLEKGRKIKKGKKPNNSSSPCRGLACGSASCTRTHAPPQPA